MVQPSPASRMSRLPALIIGSIVNVIPGFELVERARLAVVQHLRVLVEARPMPWPQNSRTTEKPLLSVKVWIAWPMSPRRTPGLTLTIPFHIAS